MCQTFRYFNKETFHGRKIKQSYRGSNRLFWYHGLQFQEY